MSATPLETLLEKLTTGDVAAAEQVFLTYEPYLRLVVHRMLPEALRPKFDSVDVVQSVWADLLRGFREADWRFHDVGHLRAFLVKATRNRFLARVRKNRRTPAQEQRMIADARERERTADNPRPSQTAQANELWTRMLATCPADHRPLLLLKREGCTLGEIAKRTGYHPSSIRRIFYDLARRMAIPKDAGP